MSTAKPHVSRPRTLEVVRERGVERAEHEVVGGSPTRLPIPKPAMDDTELLRALRDLDPSAAAAFHDRVRPAVERTLGRLVRRDDIDRDDLAQNALIAVLTSIESFRGDCPLDAWISAVTARSVYKHLRRRKLERFAFPAPLADESMLVHPDDAGCQLEVRSVLRQLQHVLSRLDPDKVWTFLLHDVCGYDLKEIASITDVSISAAQKRLVRGRAEIHAKIASEPDLVESLDEMSTSFVGVAGAACVVEERARR